LSHAKLNGKGNHDPLKGIGVIYAIMLLLPGGILSVHDAQKEFLFAWFGHNAADWQPVCMVFLNRVLAAPGVILAEDASTITLPTDTPTYTPDFHIHSPQQPAHPQIPIRPPIRRR